jgi:hypothetical protein
MAFDEKLGLRIREFLSERSDVVEQRMFGGVAFMIRGHMACGIVKNDLMVRVGPDKHDDALACPNARPMDFAGRPMRGMVYVAPAGVGTDAELRAWVLRGVAHVETLPAKVAKARKEKFKK